MVILKQMHGWNWMHIDERKRKQYFPNHIAWNNDYVVIEVRRSHRGDFALSKKATIKAKSLLDKEVGIRFCEANGDFLCQFGLPEIYRNVRSCDAIEGKFGPYWWLNEDGDVIENSSAPM